MQLFYKDTTLRFFAGLWRCCAASLRSLISLNSLTFS